MKYLIISLLIISCYADAIITIQEKKRNNSKPKKNNKQATNNRENKRTRTKRATNKRPR